MEIPLKSEVVRMVGGILAPENETLPDLSKTGQDNVLVGGGRE